MKKVFMWLIPFEQCNSQNVMIATVERAVYSFKDFIRRAVIFRLILNLPNAFSGPLSNQSAELDNNPCCKKTGWPDPRLPTCSHPIRPHGIRCIVIRYPSSVITTCASHGYPWRAAISHWKYRTTLIISCFLKVTMNQFSMIHISRNSFIFQIL